MFFIQSLLTVRSFPCPGLGGHQLLWRSPFARSRPFTMLWVRLFLFCAPLLCAAVVMDSLDVSRHILPKQSSSSPLRSSSMTKRMSRQRPGEGLQARDEDPWARLHDCTSLIMSPACLYSFCIRPPSRPLSDALHCFPMSILIPASIQLISTYLPAAANGRFCLPSLLHSFSRSLCLLCLSFKYLPPPSPARARASSAGSL